MEKSISYTFWGEEIDTNWYDWYLAVKKMYEKMGFKISHIGITCKSYSPGKIVTASRKEKYIIELLKSGEVPDFIECYSLPKDFNSAISDYDVLCSRSSKHNFISFIIKEKNLSLINENEILEMKRFIKYSNGEVYSTRDDIPLMYAYTKEKGRFKTLEFIKFV